jgi:predicted dehydrogenase
VILEKRRVAVVGVGQAGRARIKTYRGHPGYELVATIDPRNGSSTRFAEHFRNVKLGIHGTRIDVLDICTPPGTHAEMLAVAMDHQIASVCEKPLLALRDYQGVVHCDILQGPGIDLIPVQNYRMSNYWRLIKETTTQLGPLREFRVSFIRPNPSSSEGGWRLHSENDGGGILWDMGWHAVNVAEDLFGDLKAVQRRVCNLHGANCTELTLTGDQDRRVVVQLSWFGKNRENSFEVRADHQWLDLRNNAIEVFDAINATSIGSQPLGESHDIPGTGLWHDAVLKSFDDRPEDYLRSGLRTYETLVALSSLPHLQTTCFGVPHGRS